jgi:1-acyl-sn-glycerol-3-phosphate acyltransferase
VFASNHQSHLDTPAILAALPPRFRYRTAVAMAKEFFEAHFHPEGKPAWRRGLSGLGYVLAALFFNAFPLPQREAGTRRSLQYIGELLDEGLSVLVFPEGRRSGAGTILQFLPGIGMMGARLAVPIVPVRLEGLEQVLHPAWRLPRRGPVRVAFGKPLSLSGEDYEELARKVETAVREL